LIKHQEVLHEEKAEIVRAGLESSPWQQTDDTQTRVNGVTEHCHVLCNPLYTAFCTQPKIDRQSVIEVWSNPQRRRYLFNEQAIVHLQQKRQISQSLLQKVEQWQSAEMLDEEELEHVIREQLGAVSEQQKKLIKAGARVAAYQAQAEVPVVKRLACDDAGQSQEITEEVALGWVHAGRHYKKLMPVCEVHQKLLAEFVDQYWDYYRELLKYKESPTKEEAER
jgi:hypothetical protein